MNPVFTPEMMKDVAEMEKECSTCDTLYASLKAIGVPVDEREMMNETRKAMCQRVREIDAATRGVQ